MSRPKTITTKNVTSGASHFKLNMKEVDFGLAKIQAEIKKLKKKPYVKIGVLESAGRKKKKDPKTGVEMSDINAQSVAYIASVHEFGSKKRGIPERSFIRSTVNENQKNYDMHIAILKDEILDGSKKMTTEKALAILGEHIQMDIQNKFRDNDWQPLSVTTIRRKNWRQIENHRREVSKIEKKEKLNKRDKERIFTAQEFVDTGGRSTPLIDTGQLRQSIRYKVEMDGNKK